MARTHYPRAAKRTSISYNETQLARDLAEAHATTLQGAEEQRAATRRPAAKTAKKPATKKITTTKAKAVIRNKTKPKATLKAATKSKVIKKKSATSSGSRNKANMDRVRGGRVEKPKPKKPLSPSPDLSLSPVSSVSSPTKGSSASPLAKTLSSTKNVSASRKGKSTSTRESASASFATKKNLATAKSPSPVTKSPSKKRR
ncbi:hypothetical protein FB567DRAFT_543535 [Paraphoma chrysanthemicola]|uniref:Uncharacterized protein n=1 Tax=Paraphoma chrysanthemicola TaxID=798071 RepID=A0A8K0RIN3_9PLEO|nr:hypothetical protein FB567DRAFT_543535 [Paraphoma chrysanthemicola]